MTLPLPDQVNTALARLAGAGRPSYVVGGCVRDLLRGVTPGDYDIAAPALPEETKQVFAGERVIETGLKHGTVTVLLGGMPLEITTFRVDGAYTDGRHPDEVRFTSSLTEDLARRDLTVNAMAYSPEEGLVDPFGGREDLERRVIRCVGDPDARLREDALRILRALRFASALDFAIDPGTGDALRKNRERLRRVSPERIRAELGRLLCGGAVRRILMEYPEVLAVPLPELAPMFGFDQRNPHHIYDVWEHTAAAVEAVRPAPVLRFAALLHDVAKPERFSLDAQGIGHFYGHPERGAELSDLILRRLRFDIAQRERIVTLVRWHDRTVACGERSVRRALAALGTEAFFELLELKRADNLAQSPEYRGRQAEYGAVEALAREILRRGDCLTLRALAVNGADLLGLGYVPGPELGQTLRALLDAVLDGGAPNERTALLRLAEERRHPR